MNVLNITCVEGYLSYMIEFILKSLLLTSVVSVGILLIFIIISLSMFGLAPIVPFLI